MSTTYNQSANGYSAGGGGGDGPGYTENPEQNDEDEFGRTEEGKTNAH